MANDEQLSGSGAAETTGGPDDLVRLRWRCRRGMLELDVILERFLDTRMDRLGPELRLAFERLLERHDQDLMAWLLRGEPVPDPELARVVALIRGPADD